MDTPAQPAQTALGRISGWLKAALGTLAGLMSGAVVMYLTPLVDKVVRPPRPVANFGVERQGLRVTVANRAAGGTEGWWDFGDGAALEPFSPQQPTVAHVYPKPGSYSIKLTLRNLLGEENDRVIPLTVEEDADAPPKIAKLIAYPISPGAYAPATFRVECQVENAQLCVWNFEEDQPLVISMNPAEDARDGRQVTFTQPGAYAIKLAVTNGKQAAEKSTIVYVNEPPTGSLTAVVTVAEKASRLERVVTPVSIPLLPYCPTAGTAEPIERALPARQGFRIADARLLPISCPCARNVRVEIAEDHRSALLTGDVVTPAGWVRPSGPPSTGFAQIVLTQERTVPVTRPAQMVTATMSVPGTALLPLPTVPSDWSEVTRDIRVELRDGEQVVWQGAGLPRNAPLALQNRRCALSAVAASDQLRVELTEIKPSPAGVAPPSARAPIPAPPTPRPAGVPGVTPPRSPAAN